MRALTVALFFLSLTSIAQTTCLDPLACNFTEIGDCVYLDIDGLPCVSEGCAIPGACNFDPEADINDGSCEFTSCLGCTDETACNYEPEALYLDLSCIYYVDCHGVCGGDWIEDECGNCFDPIQDNLPMTVEDGFIQLCFESERILHITAGGARGGWNSSCGPNGGYGAIVSGVFQITGGTCLNILVGEQGEIVQSNFANDAGSGGGGSFVWINGENELILVAGGGGGGAICSSGGSQQNSPGMSASFFTYGSNDRSGSEYGGVNGEDAPQQGGGLGWNSILSGVYWDDSSPIVGGYGGGGAQSGEHSGGGGGGYSGGAARPYSGLGSASGGGGGGCYCEGDFCDFQLNSTNDGFITIEQVGGEPTCLLGCVVEQACNFNPEATNDNGTCDFCFCGPGTAWDNLSEQCLIVEGSSDIDGDGCTNLSDLLDLLADYGICDE